MMIKIILNKMHVLLNLKFVKAIMNYRRKSTEGWAVGCIFLDIVGGIFSMAQMLLNAYNYSK